MSRAVGKVVFDVTACHRGLVGGGIRRVGLELAAASCAHGRARAAVLEADDLRSFDGRAVGAPVRLEEGDVYAIMDSLWDPREDYVRSLRRAKQAGVTTAICIHDVLPLDMPGLVEPSYHHLFKDSLHKILPHVDVVIGVSRASLRRVRCHLRERGFAQPAVWFHHGADVFAEAADRRSDAGTQFLALGTIEPKKNYPCLLDAFETVWTRGTDAACVIVGRPGWLCATVLRRIQGHAEFGRRLIWHGAAEDREVAVLMRSSRCLIQASVAEGFGLPLIEAAAAGLPVIASDLAVFREIAGDGITYFKSGDSAALADRIEAACLAPPPPPAVRLQSWAQATDQLVGRLVAAASGVAASGLRSAA